MTCNVFVSEENAISLTPRNSLINSEEVIWYDYCVDVCRLNLKEEDPRPGTPSLVDLLLTTLYSFRIA